MDAPFEWSPPAGWPRKDQRSLYNHRDTHREPKPEEVANQATLLNQHCYHVVAASEIQRSEIAEKEAFRVRIEQLIRDAITRHEMEQTEQDQPCNFPSLSVELKCFGSLSSGFATKASDMDLALLSPLSRVQPDDKGSPIPRLIEKTLLDAGIGARLLTRTRVPIIKLCEQPPEALYRNLLAQRGKWESGLGNEGAEDNEDDDHDHEEDQSPAAEAHTDRSGNGAPPTEGEPLTYTEFEVPSIDGGEPLRLYLRQGPGTSLTSYYGVAKRVLRKAGIRDLRTPTIHSYTPLQWDILDRVCRAFIRGLSDSQLRERLEQYPSLSPEPVPDSPLRRSLMTVFAQVEGEQMLLSWEAWNSREGINTKDPQLEQVIDNWLHVQRKRTHGIDPMGDHKELQASLLQLQRIPSMQLCLLVQGSEETAAQYYVRARKVMDSLKHRQLILPRGLERTVVDQYVSGIRPKEIGQSVKDYVDSSPVTLSLDAVARRHKSLQLAREYTRALEKDSYDAQHVEDINAYINLLQSPPYETSKENEHVPMSEEHRALICRIQALPDPHSLAPNQPKDRYRDQLEFPKSGAGVQCDINFSAHLALQNTTLLRCYSHTDPRVRPMVLFVKHWAKLRGINSGYRGTLSSYGYVLMVIHYLVNVAQPFVCPNLQQLAPPVPPNLPPAVVENTVHCKGANIQFWRNEEEIMHLASHQQITRNTASIGHLLRGFFEYFAQSGVLSNGATKGFDWGRDVLSLRTPGGLVSKQIKGWTGAKTVYEVHGDQGHAGTKASPPANKHSKDLTGETQSNTRPKGDDVKEVRLRYLFAIEDPFELDHNVARTVTHNGIVSIRDEFRRAWRIINSAGHGDFREDLLRDVNEDKQLDRNTFVDLLKDIHGAEVFVDDA